MHDDQACVFSRTICAARVVCKPIYPISITCSQEVFLQGMINTIKRYIRKEPRYNKTIESHFQSESGVVCAGLSKNINKTAILVVMDRPCQASPTESGDLIINYHERRSVFPCRVLRVDKYCLDKYYVALQYHGTDASDFFHSLIVNSSTCYSCGSKDQLTQCPECKGINTVCASCLKHERACKDCRSVKLLYQDRLS